MENFEAWIDWRSLPRHYRVERADFEKLQVEQTVCWHCFCCCRLTSSASFGHTKFYFWMCSSRSTCAKSFLLTQIRSYEQTSQSFGTWIFRLVACDAELTQLMLPGSLVLGCSSCINFRYKLSFWHLISAGFELTNHSTYACASEDILSDMSMHWNARIGLFGWFCAGSTSCLHSILWQQ